VIGRGIFVGLNVHAPTEDKSDDKKDSFYEDLEPVFDVVHMREMRDAYKI
jgi:hypothetical protein